MKSIVYWGATGQAKVLYEFAEAIGFRLVALFENNIEQKSPFPGVPIYYGEEGFSSWMAQRSGNISGLAAIGGGNGKSRLQIHDLFREKGIEVPVAVHPTAFVAGKAVLSEGCQILAHAKICADAVLGRSSIVNTGASVDHECKIGEGVHIAPGATLAGCVDVGDFTFVAVGAVVLPKIKIGSNVIVGAGAVVTKDVPDDVVVYGNPARYIRKNSNK